MKSDKKILFCLFLLVFINPLLAREGMWIPTLLAKYNIEEMQQMGFRLSAEDVYSINQNSMKDAVVLFGSGCTGELVSADGLLFTNHHCGYSAIQSHSSVENDYLTTGFWAKSREEELSNPGLSVRFLIRMDDVTRQVLAGTDTLAENEQMQKIEQNIEAIRGAAGEDGRYEVVVKPLFYGNQYFVYVYQVYPDVRLVGAPPSSIGKFGGDTDNWMWPRHTGDFSVFRIYAGKNNEPAAFSPDNVPYHPKSFFPVSLEGIKPDDFVMIYGFPGSTEQYLPSQAVDLIMNQSDPDRVRIREEKLNILERHMSKDPGVRIQYASKYAGTSNSRKRWQGEIRGLKRMNAIAAKQSFEKQFQSWYNQHDSLRSAYGTVFEQFEKLYIDLAPYNRAYNYYMEIVLRGTDIFSLAASFPRNESSWSDLSDEQAAQFQNQLINRIESYFKNYDQTTDEEVFVRLMRILKKDLDPSFLPSAFHELMDSYTDDALLKKVYRRSVLIRQETLTGLARNLDEGTIKKLRKDPVFDLFIQLYGHYQRNIELVYKEISQEIESVQKNYMAGILKTQQHKPLYPDANLTLRVAYGKVEGYKPADAVSYKHYTTLEGIIQKDNPEIYDYDVPQRLTELHRQKNYMNYSDENGEIPVAFIASAHTTGGNSGSPAINANGALVGINFDRCWEGTMSDILFDPDQCRNIMVDIRYVLFIIDRFAGAGYLLNEMSLVE
ncbi:MAG: S46 family peptidase [Prolixibacteraceae bacterium]